MSELMKVQQKGAVSVSMTLEDELFGENFRSRMERTLPQWLSPERFLRVVYSSCIKNPKLMQCSRESILNAVIQCAQVGLEPVLGRAHLVPYRNNSKVGKPFEAKFIPGYQGLIDLARRSKVVVDVWGANVYENDHFVFNLGMERALVHTPWYMVEKAKKKGPGEIIGAYVVWLLKDGTKHPEFMPISDIYRRRDKSQSWQWAEYGDPKRGGGKKDSVWHEWPEEQTIKTVVIHSSKFVPASIDFMQAVSADESEYAVIDNEFSPKTGGFITPLEASRYIEQTEPPSDDFDTYFSDQDIDKQELSRYVDYIATRNMVTLQTVKINAMENLDDFLVAFNEWSDSKQVENQQATADAGDPLDRDNWINIKSADGYATFVFKHKSLIEKASPAIQAEMKDKWNRIVRTNDPWPVKVANSGPSNEPVESNQSSDADYTDFWSLPWPSGRDDDRWEEKIAAILSACKTQSDVLEVNARIVSVRADIGDDLYKKLVQLASNRMDAIINI